MALSTRSKDLAIGVGVVLFILYLVGGFGYAIYSYIVDPPGSRYGYADDFPYEPGLR